MIDLIRAPNESFLRRSIVGGAASLWLVVTAVAFAAEPPSITGLFPPGGQVGAELEVDVKGKVGDGLLQVWSDQQQLVITLNEKQDKATVKIPAAVEPGIHWLRFFNQHGCTDLLPFFVGELPEVAETEPNNAISEFQPIEPGTVNGTLHKSGEVDLFGIELRQGETLTALVQANRELGSPMDGVLEILDQKGTILFSNDDDHGNDPRAEFTATVAGMYLIRLFAFPAAPNSSIRFHGGANYVYRMTLRTEMDRPQPVSESDPGELKIPWAHEGVIRRPGEEDQFAFDARKGQQVTVAVVARKQHSKLDPIATLRTEAGKVIKEFDDISRSDADVRFSIAFAEDTRYVLAVKDRFGTGGIRHHYVASIEPNEPRFEATVATSSFVLPADKPLDIPVTVNRLHGYAQRIAFSVEGLPEGVTADQVHSEPEGDSAKGVTVKIQRAETAKPYAGVIKIICTAQDADARGADAQDADARGADARGADEGADQTTPATAAVPRSDKRTESIWLTVVP